MVGGAHPTNVQSRAFIQNENCCPILKDFQYLRGEPFSHFRLLISHDSRPHKLRLYPDFPQELEAVPVLPAWGLCVGVVHTFLQSLRVSDP